VAVPRSPSPCRRSIGPDVARILVVDDEAQIRTALARALFARGYEVDAAADGQDALDRAAVHPPDLVVLDLNMPVMGGLEVTRRIRSWSAVPILVLSVRDEEPDKIAALDLGADDYLTKPFGVGELLARVRALLRRADVVPDRPPPRYRIGDVEIDMGAHRVARSGDDVHLTKTEWALLDAFVGASGKLLTHRWLLEHVWGDGYGDDVEVLRVFVSQLRKKIESDPQRPQAIVTEPGVGYRWSVRPVSDGV
jgi:two-component system, OmpR family, KDP operon response regulator KdpE